MQLGWGKEKFPGRILMENEMKLEYCNYSFMVLVVIYYGLFH